MDVSGPESQEVVATVSARAALIWKSDWGQGSASTVAQSPGCWQEVLVPCHMELFTGGVNGLCWPLRVSEPGASKAGPGCVLGPNIRNHAPSFLFVP